MSIITILDFIFLTCLFIFIYSFLQRTDTVKIFIGLLIIFLSYLFLDYVGLERTAYLLKKGFELMSLGLLVIFHPELRMFLKKVGGFTLLKENTDFDEVVMNEIKNAVFEMSKSKTGALIILDDSRNMMIDNGTIINASCKKALIENIFFKNSPLHDGAMIIRKGVIEACGVKLSFSGNKRKDMGYLGVRHHVALETSINNDVKALVVSEETGNVSVAYGNKLKVLKNKDEFAEFFNIKSDR